MSIFAITNNHGQAFMLDFVDDDYLLTIKDDYGETVFVLDMRDVRFIRDEFNKILEDDDET